MSKRIHWVPAAAHFNLGAACRVVNDAFREDGYGCYHVGSSLVRGDYQDVDVRYIMSDEGFAQWFGGAENLHLNPVWALMCTAIGTWLSKQSGLPVDFQIQQMTAANAEFSGERHPIGYPVAAQPSRLRQGPAMTQSTTLKPSERIQQLADELRPQLKGSALETSEAELRLCCVIAYLDERDASVHPIARAHPAPASPPGEDNAASVDWDAAGREALSVYRAETMAIGCGRTAGFSLGNVRRAAALLEEAQSERDEALAKLAASEARTEDYIRRLDTERNRVAFVESERDEALARCNQLWLSLKTAIGDCDYVCGQREVLQRQVIERTTNLTESEATVARLRKQLEQVRKLETVALERGRNPSLSNQVCLDEMCRSMAITARKLGVCEGCDTLPADCGPALWATQRKCCPDCTHARYPVSDSAEGVK